MLKGGLSVQAPAALFKQSWRGLHGWILAWWRLLITCAALLVLLLSPSSYRTLTRMSLAQHLVQAAAPMLVGFCVLTAIFTVMLTHIVVVTAHSYGLSQLALQVVIRVLVLELIPMTAVGFVALRCTIPDGAELARWLRTAGAVPTHAQVQQLVLPRLAGALFAGALLAALASVLALVVAYLVRYGFSASGLVAYTRLFGQVFNPTVIFILVSKLILLCLTVSLIPLASALIDSRERPGTVAEVRTSAEMRALVRMAVVVLAIEVASLVGNYA